MTGETAASLLAENMNTVFAWALSRTGDHYRAQDLASDIFVAVLASAERLKNDDAFFGFLWQIAANTYKNYRRSYSRAQAHEQALPDDVPIDDRLLDELCEQETLSTLWRELSLLTAHYRECTVAYYFDGLSCAEIARRTGLSPGTVKQYLFKTRKILKEGIAMDREFGEKSFRPAPFQFRTIYSGNYSKEYDNLFSRRLPGQILLAAYYAPISIRELTVELGVAGVYLEDEVDLLLRYNMLNRCGDNKLSTNLLIFTKEFIDAQFDRLDKEFSADIAAFIHSLRERLPAVRAIGFAGCDLSENALLWDLFAFSVLHGIGQLDRGGWEELYGATTGLSYGIGYEQGELKYSYYSFAGTSHYDLGYSCSYISFDVTSTADRHFGRMSGEELKEASGKTFPELTESQVEQLVCVLEEEIQQMVALMERITAMNVELLCEYAPEPLHEKIHTIYPKIDLWEIMGWYGAAAVQSGVLKPAKPEDMAGVIGYV